MKISERKLTRVSLFRNVCVGKNMKNSINLRVSSKMEIIV